MSSGFLLLSCFSIFVVIFYFLKPYHRVLISLIIMSNCFELLPYEIAGIKLWDVGIILFFISGFSYLSTNKDRFPLPKYYYFFIAFIGILFLSFFYSVVVYSYPFIETIKASRQMILGYLTFFVFIRLFKNDQEAFSKFHTFFFWFFLMMMVINLAQFLTGHELLRGYVSRQKGGAIRSVPIFLPIASIYVWQILSSYLTKSKVTFYNLLYIILYFTSLAISFTRGYYVAIMLMILLMAFMLIKDKKILFTKSLKLLIIGISLAVFVLITPKMDRFVNRAKTTFATVFQLRQEARKIDVNNNTFGLRLFILKERMQLVLQHNPFLGYGFIYEDRAHQDVGFHFGTWDKIQQRKGFFSADIAWANIIIYTGFLGTAIFSLFIIFFFAHHFMLRFKNDKYYLLNLSYLLSFMTMFVLMWNGASFSRYVQLQMYNLAICLYLSFKHSKESASEKNQIAYN